MGLVARVQAQDFQSRNLPPPPGGTPTPPPASPGAATSPATPATSPAPGTHVPSPPATSPTPPAPAAAAPPAPAAAQLRALVVDAGVTGIDPRVGEHVTYVMRTTLAEMGYAVLSRAETIAAARQVQMGFPPTTADLWRVTHAGNAQRGAFARVWADSGRYVFELSVASADGTGPFFARGTSGAEDLYAVVAGLTRQAVPPPTTWDAAGAARYSQPRPQPTTPPQVAPPVARVAPSAQPTWGLRPESAETRRARRRPTRRYDLRITTEAAIGADSRRFYGHLVGMALGVRITRTIMLSAHLSYVTLPGRTQRVHNLLPMLMFEKRIRLSPRIDLTVPLKAAVGFLPQNGAVVRFSGGLAYAISERVELAIDLLTPTFWFIGEEPRISLNVGLGFIYRL